jgi:hypothetical protein
VNASITPKLTNGHRNEGSERERDGLRVWEGNRKEEWNRCLWKGDFHQHGGAVEGDSENIRVIVK